MSNDTKEVDNYYTGVKKKQFFYNITISVVNQFKKLIVSAG